MNIGVVRKAGGLAAALAVLVVVSAAGTLWSPPARAQLKKGKVFKTQRQTCLDCHASEAKEYGRRDTVHAPVAAGDCESCHQRHGVVGLLRLTAEDPELCLSCHVEPGAPALEEPAKDPPAAVMPHPPGEEMRCGSCHDPHGSDGEHLLVQAGPDMCLTCHDTADHEGASSHADSGVGCLTCHDPHGTGEAGGLRAAGEDLCGSCHDGTARAEMQAHGGGVPEAGTCLTCHGPHASESDALLLPVVHGALAEGGDSCALCHGMDGDGDGAWALTAPAAEMCLSCHEDPRGGAEGTRVHGALGDGNCMTCHTPHASTESALLSGTQGEVCGTCHVEAEAAAGAAHPHEPAAANCTVCHQPHAGGEGLLTASGPDLCLTCHGEVSGEIGRSGPHPPAAEDCLTCHDPHGTEHPGILQASQGELCGACHDSLASDLEARFPHQPVVSGECMGCHEPHGSDGDHLVVEDLSAACSSCHEVLDKTLAGEGRHAPYAAGECLACHSPHSAPRAGLLNEESLVLCRTCHEESEEERTAWSRHLPVQRGQCLTCHNPHGGFEPGLQHRGDGRTLCVTCHTEEGETMSRRDITVHQPFREMACTTCHTPHASDHAPLLAEAPGPLCTTCHDLGERALTQAHRGLASETTDCAGCHEPHASETEGLMLAAQHAPFAERECGDCHHGGSGQ